MMRERPHAVWVPSERESGTPAPRKRRGPPAVWRRPSGDPAIDTQCGVVLRQVSHLYDRLGSGCEQADSEWTRALGHQTHLRVSAREAMTAVSEAWVRAAEC